MRCYESHPTGRNSYSSVFGLGLPGNSPDNQRNEPFMEDCFAGLHFESYLKHNPKPRMSRLGFGEGVSLISGFDHSRGWSEACAPSTS